MLYTLTNVKAINSKMKKIEALIGQRVFYDPSDCTFLISVDGHIKCIGVLGMEVDVIVHNAERERARRS